MVEKIALFILNHFDILLISCAVVFFMGGYVFGFTMGEESIVKEIYNFRLERKKNLLGDKKEKIMKILKETDEHERIWMYNIPYEKTAETILYELEEK